MKWLDRIAQRLGYIPAWEAAPSEIIVFSSAEAARQAGFRGGVHPRLPSVRAYWPGLGERGLAGRPVRRVTIADRRYRDTPEGPLRAILRKRQMVFGDGAVWIEL